MASKMTSILNMALLMGAIPSAQSGVLPDAERKFRREEMDLKNSKTEKEKALLNGLKEFDFSGTKIYALNQKNAEKKARKLGLI